VVFPQSAAGQPPNNSRTTLALTKNPPSPVLPTPHAVPSPSGARDEVSGRALIPRATWTGRKLLSLSPTHQMLRAARGAMGVDPPPLPWGGGRDMSESDLFFSSECKLHKKRGS